MSAYRAELLYYIAHTEKIDMPKYTTINVKPDADQDDCLTTAANAYIAEHPELDGYDLSPRWADDSRESVELTVPATDPQRLARAAQHIDACELPDGEYAHYDDATSRWYVVSAAELAELCDYLDDADPQINRDAYSHWCAGTSAAEMPEAWQPPT